MKIAKNEILQIIKEEIANEMKYKSHLDGMALFKKDLYIRNTLGIKLPLNESGAPKYTSEMRLHILEEHLLFEGFFDRFNPINAIKKYGKEVGDLFSALYNLIRQPRFIPQYVNSLVQKIVKPFINKMKKFSQWLNSKNMPTFAAGLDKLLNKMEALYNLEGWKQALAITGAVIGVQYVKEKLKDIGFDISNFTAAKKELLNRAQNFLIVDFPKTAIYLYGAAGLAASTGFLGWMVAAAGVLKVVNIAKDALKGALGRFNTKVGRIKRREAAAAAGGGPVLNRDEDY